jgi:hypothetical protein
MYILPITKEVKNKKYLLLVDIIKYFNYQLFNYLILITKKINKYLIILEIIMKYCRKIITYVKYYFF